MIRTKKKSFALYQISLKAVIKNRQGQTLLLKNTGNESSPRDYDLPGGRITPQEQNSSVKSVLLREIKEEIGKAAKLRIHEVPVAIGRHSYMTQGERRAVLWVVFNVDYLGGKLRLSKEHSKLLWQRITLKNAKDFFVKGSLDAMTHYLTRKLP